MPQVFPDPQERRNRVNLLFPGTVHPTVAFTSCLPTACIPTICWKTTQCLPLYRYTEDGKQVSNITNWGIQQFNEHYRKEWGTDFETVTSSGGITAEDIFAYVYAVLHDPVYREKYAVGPASGVSTPALLRGLLGLGCVGSGVAGPAYRV